MKITGAKAWVFFDSFDKDKIISGGAGVTTKAEEWYLIIDKGEGSQLKLPKGFPVRAPKGDAQIALVQGDRIFPLDPKRFCKTSVSLQVEQGTVDVGDDCDPGATIPDGIFNISGSLAGLFRFDNETMEFDNVTSDIMNKFFDVIEDDTSGMYRYTPRDDEAVYLLCCLNSNAKVGQIENWIFVPIVLSSFSLNLGNTDAQSKDLSWSKGEGAAVIYKRPRTE
jgi:hypothetical protein